MKKKIAISVLLILLVLGSVALYLYFDFTQQPENSALKFNRSEFLIDKTNEKNADSAELAKNEMNMALFLDSVVDASNSNELNLKGERITIAITGIDARLGSNVPHADANHVVNFWLDTGIVEVISVPRGTFVDAGFPDTSNLNYLANLRANRGRDRYLQELAKIAGIPKIDYYVEFGFSQAIGILELLGFKGNAVQMLRVLRSRKSFSVGDYQRAFNQGQFIRQMILSQFHKADNISGDLLINGGLMLTETNLNKDIANYIVKKLNKHGFPRSAHDVSVKLKPKLTTKLSVFNFTDEKSRDSLYKYVAEKSKYADSGATDVKFNDNSRVNNRAYNAIKKHIDAAKKSEAKNPNQVVSTLRKVFDQKAWYQIVDLEQRKSVRLEVCNMLINAYTKLKKTQDAETIKSYLNTEDKLEQQGK